MKSLRPTKQKILDLLREQHLSPFDLQQLLDISASVVHTHLKSLLEMGLIEKFGSAPRVSYGACKKDAADYVNEHFLFQDALGNLRAGMEGFRLWSAQGLKKLSFEEKVALYADRVLTAESHKQDGVFNLIGKLQKVVDVGEKMHLKEMACLSLRTLRDFGRTKMGIYVDIVKSAGSKKIVDIVLDFSVPLIVSYAKKHRINAVGFIPPTRRRSQQIMTALEDRFRKGPFRTAAIEIKKIRGDIPREQKTIRDLRDRIYNSDHTFFLSPYAHLHNYKRILLVDDVIGSGATLNQVAKLLKKRGFAGEVFGLAVVGEEKGYSVEKVS